MGDTADGESPDMYGIAMLIEQLRTEDSQQRLASVRQLSSIAKALGEERSREELVPFLTESIDDDDEVLLELAEQLGNMAPDIGGAPFAYCLLQPLETLAAVEETVVRDKAVEALCKVGNQMLPEHMAEHYVEVLRRLSTGDWFTSRVSSCGLFPLAYDKVDDPEVKNQLSAWCERSTPVASPALAGLLMPQPN
jgi:serine/threonine-protein phosphatase 2A regulatory subunit A